jgi:predicted permease
MNHSLDDFVRDAKQTLRAMRKAPLFAFFAVLTLGIGIGASTTVFTIVNTLLLNPLPARDPSGLVALYTTPSKTDRQARTLLPTSYLNLQDLGTKNTVFSALAGYTAPLVLTWKADTGQQRIFGELVTGQYFEALGIRPATGRFFLQSENTTPGSANVAVLSYAAWQRNFGGESDVLGRRLDINGTPFTVIGVAPSGFIGVSAVFGPDVWLPATMAQQILPAQSRDALTERGRDLFHAVARLKPGITREQANADVQRVAAALEREYPHVNENRTISVQPIANELFSGAGGERALKFASTGLFVLVGVVLLIACSNVANLLQARTSSRKQELSIRLAIGAGRGRIVRQFLVESVVLALLGGVAGLALGYEGCQLVWTLRPAEVAANLISPRLDMSVFLFAFLVSLATGLLFGVVPALYASKTDVIDGLKQETRIAGVGRRSAAFANALLAGQVALSLVSLIAAALFLRSIQRAYQIDPGFDSKHLAMFMMNPEQAGYNQARVKTFYRDLRQDLSKLPGITAASWASNLPFWSSPSRALVIEGREQLSKSENPVTIVDTIDVDYFSTMRIPVLEGRDFTEKDRDGSVPVAVVNEYLAQKYWPGSGAQPVGGVVRDSTSAVGHRFRFSDDPVAREVIGVVKTTNYTGLGEKPQACVYLPLRQNFVEGAILYVRGAADPGTIIQAVQREIHNAAPQVQVSDIRTGQKIISQVLFIQSIGVGILGVFGLVALGLASVGLYGLLAYSVSQRHKEIGVRMAMGAESSTVLRLILRQGMKLVSIGILIGLALSLLAGRALSRMLVGVSGYDPLSLAGASAVLIVVALIACYVPARIASRVDPMAALREA